MFNGFSAFSFFGLSLADWLGWLYTLDHERKNCIPCFFIVVCRSLGHGAGR